jgi:hypothetical protein
MVSQTNEDLCELLFSYFVALLANWVAAGICDRRGRLTSTRTGGPLTPLSDIGHSLLPDMKHTPHLPDLWVLFFTTSLWWAQVTPNIVWGGIREHTHALWWRSVITVSTTLPRTGGGSDSFGGEFDLMFSGHAAYFVIVSRALTSVYSISLILPFLLFSLLSIVATRQHYTADVLVAVAIVL